MVSYETVRRWVNYFGPIVAADLRKRRPKPHSTWHLDEVHLKIGGRMVYLWRAVDAEGEVLDVLVQSKRNKHARYGYFFATRLVIDCSASISAVRDACDLGYLVTLAGELMRKLLKRYALTLLQPTHAPRAGKSVHAAGATTASGVIATISLVAVSRIGTSGRGPGPG